MPRMFQISAAHLQAFSEQQRGRFEDEMVAYLQKEYPADCEKAGEQGIRELVRRGIEKASEYHIVLECDVSRYIELMLTVAPDFDVSERTPWAGPVLAQTSMTGDSKINRMYERLVFAENQELAISLSKPPRPIDPRAAAQATERLRREYPLLLGQPGTRSGDHPELQARWVALYREAEAMQ